MKKQKAKNPDHVGIGKFWAWGSREVSETTNILIQGFFMFYCTNTLMLNPAILGILMALSKGVDAVTDLVVGYIVDKTKTPLGKGRPYELCIFGTWICTYLMYSCPADFGNTMKYVWVTSMYILVNALFNTFLNAGENVYMVRAFKSGQIVRLSSFGGLVSSGVGFIVNIIAPQLVERFSNVQGGWSKIILYMGTPVLIIGIMRFIFIKEQYDLDVTRKTEELKLDDTVKMLKRNPYIWIVALITFFGQVGSQLGLGVFYFKEVLGSIELQSITSAVTILALPLVFVFPKCIKMWKVRNLLIIGSCFSAAGGLICFLSNKNIAVYMAGWLLVGMGSLPGTYLMRLMMYDCSSYNEWKKMPRMEGTIGSVQGFAKRLGGALAGGFGGIYLSLIGYNPEAAISAGTVMGIRVGTTLIPAIASVLTMGCLLFYKLDTLMPQINEDNEHTRAVALADENEKEKKCDEKGNL